MHSQRHQGMEAPWEECLTIEADLLDPTQYILKLLMMMQPNPQRGRDRSGYQ
jgi:hypothetical protein